MRVDVVASTIRQSLCSRDEGSICVSMTWRTLPIRPYILVWEEHKMRYRAVQAGSANGQCTDNLTLCS